ncbi:MAG: methylene-tetrahydromethanopterin dehydrogenase N-terminal domain-containing protein [Candidatus Thorarchaeota archaeon]
MEVLELKPLKKSKLKIVLIESEFPIDWWFESSAQKKHDLVWNLNLISKEYINLVEGLINKYHPNFVTEEKGSRWEEVISQEDPIAILLRTYNIPYQMVDISENAEGYLYVNFDEYRTLIKDLERNLINYSNSSDSAIQNEFEYQRALLWKEHLQQEYNNKENEIRFKVREAWMMMKIIKIAKEIEKKNLTAFHICDPRHFEGFKELSEDLGVAIEEIRIKREAKIIQNSELFPIRNSLNNSIIELTPVKIKKKEKIDKICYFFDTDEKASPFDINMAYDAGFDVVVPFNNIKAKDVKKLVQDAIFSRKPGAPTSFFIGGSDVKEGEKIAQIVIDSLVPPFECPVIIDPRGSHTTASSIVVQTMEVAKYHKIDDLRGKKVAILGAGPVAQIAAILAAELGCQIYIIETWSQSNEEFIEDLALNLSNETRSGATRIKGKIALHDEEKYNILKDVDIIWSLAAAGVQVLSRDVMNKLKNKIVFDINLVPPYGIDGLKPKDSNKEIYPTIFGTGALTVGRLKSKVEEAILKEASEINGKKVFNYHAAFEKAKIILFGSEIMISQ